MDLQEFVAKWYASQDYNASVATLALGLVEEVGELAEALLITQCRDFHPSQHKSAAIKDGSLRINVSAEVGDVLLYLMALCNRLDIRAYVKCLSAEVKILVQATEVR